MRTTSLMEANLLRFLVRREGQVVSRKDILEQVWGVHEDTDTRAIDNFIVRLRRHIEEDAAAPRHLVTVRSVGSRFIANPSRASGAPLPRQARSLCARAASVPCILRPC